MNGEQSQGDKNGTFPALRKLRAENQGTEIASELASILGMVDYGELSAHSAEGAPDRETEAMVDAARGIMQILRGKPGCTEQDVFRHCKLAGYSTEGLHEHDGSYVTEARAAAMIWRAMMRVAPRSHERSVDDEQPDRLGWQRLEGTRQNARYWQRGAWNEPKREDALLAMEQSMLAYKNAAYSLAEELERAKSSAKLTNEGGANGN